MTNRYILGIIYTRMKITNILQLVEFMRGKKTNIVGLLIFTVIGLNAIDVLTDDVTVKVVTALGGAGLLTLRDAISRLGK